MPYGRRMVPDLAGSLMQVASGPDPNFHHLDIMLQRNSKELHSTFKTNDF